LVGVFLAGLLGAGSSRVSRLGRSSTTDAARALVDGVELIEVD